MIQRFFSSYRPASALTYVSPKFWNYHQIKERVDTLSLHNTNSSSNSYIFDLRGPAMYNKAHIPFARNFPDFYFWTAFATTSDVEFESIFGFKKPQPTDEIILYCMYGLKSRKIADMLAVDFSFQDVTIYSGGWAEWLWRNKLIKKGIIGEELDFQIQKLLYRKPIEIKKRLKTITA